MQISRNCSVIVFISLYIKSLLTFSKSGKREVGENLQRRNFLLLSTDFNMLVFGVLLQNLF